MEKHRRQHFTQQEEDTHTHLNTCFRSHGVQSVSGEEQGTGGQVGRGAETEEKTFTENPLRCLFLSHKEVSPMLDEVWSASAPMDAPCRANLGRLHTQHGH